MRKKLGQHFLVSEDKAEKIIGHLQIKPSDSIVEIGPGKGILSDRIIQAGNDFTAIELDTRLANSLKKKYKEKKQFQIFNEDAAKFDYGLLKRPFKVVSNLPYCAAVPILFRLMEFKDNISLMVLMFQLEVAQRLTAPPGGKSYNPLSILTQYHTSTSLEFTLPREDFSPSPKVESAVVTFVPHATPPVAVKGEEFFFSLVKTAFAHRRKKLINNLKALPLPVSQIEAALESCALKPNERAESVPMDAFAQLSNILSSI